MGDSWMRRATALLASLGLLLSMLPATALASPSATNSWIVTVRNGTDPEAAARSLTRAHGGEVKYVYDEALNGFAFRGSAAAADAMRRNPNVTRVEADAEVWLDTTQLNATWGLDRIDQANGLDGTYTYDTTGAGVTAYIIDSGILKNHTEFGTRASTGKDFVGTNGGEDCNGHGTHVAGTIGGTTYGVAKDIKLVAVRVFDCTGGSSWSTIIAAINWVIGDHNGPNDPDSDTETDELAVANMSLSGGANSSVDEAVQNMIADGVATAVAAGNGNFVGRQDDACKYSPARTPEAMTISATDKTDTKASWANYGSCVDWFAPGVSITSAWIDSTTDDHTISGTSMATPHTAGVAALYLQRNPAASPQQVRDAIFKATTQGIVKSSSTANNHLLYSGFITGGGGGTAPATGTLSGTVSGSDTSSGISGATVTVANGSFSASTQTLPDGSYEIASVPEGTDYTVTASANGYDSAQQTGVQITGNAATDVDFLLNKSTAQPVTFGVTLAPSSTSQGNTWTAIVTIAATDSNGRPVDGVKVTGSWGGGASGTPSCTTGNPDASGVTDGSGQCVVSASGIHKRTASMTFTVTEVAPTDGFNGSMPSTTVTKP